MDTRPQSPPAVRLYWWILLLPLIFFISPTSGSASAAGKATTVIEGEIPLPGSPPPAVMARRYEIISRGGVLSTIPPIGVVWLEGTLPLPESLPDVEIIQKDFTFDPALLAVPVGTRIFFPNKDLEYHNVFSYSPPARFDLGRYLPDERPIPSHVFNHPGMVTLRCDIHEHMRAIILVIPNGYFTETDTDGRFRLEGVPPGTYTLKAWVDSRTTLEREITIAEGEPVFVRFP